MYEKSLTLLHYTTMAIAIQNFGLVIVGRWVPTTIFNFITTDIISMIANKILSYNNMHYNKM